MNVMKLVLMMCCTFVVTSISQAMCEDLNRVGNALSPANHAYGRTLTKDDLHGRVVIVWNISEFVSADAQEENNNNQYTSGNRNRNKDEEENDHSIKGIEKKIRKVAKGAIKDGRLCVIAVCNRPENSLLEKRLIKDIRKKKPYFPVYFIDASHALFNAKGDSVNKAGIQTIVDSEHFTKALEEAPDYLPGRIILVKSKHHGNLCNRFVKGKNIEQPLMQLKKAAQGNNEKAEEAKLLVAEVQAFIDDSKAEIESNLSCAPALALTQFMTLKKTSPSSVRSVAEAVGKYSKSQEVAFMSSVYTFLREAGLGEYGKGDLGRNSDAFTKRLTALTKSTDSAIATEATSLIEALTPYTTASLEAAEAAERESLKKTKQEDKERDEAFNEMGKGKNKREKGKKEKSVSNRVTALKVLSAYASEESLAAIKDELGVDVRTCNFENLRNGYTTIAQQSSERGKAAKTAVEAINSYMQAKQEALKNIISNSNLLDLHNENDDWEDVITVNFPSLQRTDYGSAALKAIRDSEVRKIYVAYMDATTGSAKRKENDDDNEYGSNSNNESAEDYAVKNVQYKITKYQALAKYMNTRSAYGKACVKQLANMGITPTSITETITQLKNDMKNAKKAAKEAEKQQRENQRNR